MRIKFGNKIFLCTKVSHPQGGDLLIITTPNSIYTVKTSSCKEAEFILNNLLINGYYDVSEYEYSN